MLCVCVVGVIKKKCVSCLLVLPCRCECVCSVTICDMNPKKGNARNIRNERMTASEWVKSIDECSEFGGQRGE
jgi:hypothetical protein